MKRIRFLLTLSFFQISVVYAQDTQKIEEPVEEYSLSDSITQNKFIDRMYKRTGYFFDLKEARGGTHEVHVRLAEAFFVPGGGHIVNEHLLKAGFSAVVSLAPIGLAVNSLNRAGDIKRYNLLDTNGYANKREYDLHRAYFHHSHYAQGMILLGTFHFLDSLFEALILHGRLEPEDTQLFLAPSMRRTAYSSYAEVDKTTVKHDETTTGGTEIFQADKITDSFVPGLLISAETGRVARKRFKVDISPNSRIIDSTIWLGVPLSKYGVATQSLWAKKLTPVFGFHYIGYASIIDDKPTPLLYNSSLNQFSLDAFNFWLGAVWNSGRLMISSQGSFLERLSGGVGMGIIDMGTRWVHPMDARDPSDPDRVGSLGATSLRSSGRGFLKSLHFQTWIAYYIWRNFSVSAELIAIKANEPKDVPSGTLANVNLMTTQLRVVAGF